MSAVVGNTEHADFSQRTGSPGLLPFCRQPNLRPIVLNVSAIDQGNQDIDIKENRVTAVPHRAA